jgi:hypothetical protein
VADEETMPDPQQAFDEHDPSIEPYASMTRDEVFALMQAVEDPKRWAFLNEFLMDKMSTKELETNLKAQKIAIFLMDEYGTFGSDQNCYMARLGGEIAARIAKDIPARGKPEECN